MKNIRIIGILVLLPIIIFLTNFFLNVSTAPFIWIGLVWLVCLSIVTLLATSQFVKLTAIYIAAVVIALTLFESYLWITKPESYSRYEGVYQGYYQHDHPILGYAPVPNIVRPSAKRYYKDELLYDVTYTINKDGLRTTGSTNKTIKDDGCIIFFGGSFTFGEGVNDEESLPFQTALLKNTYRVYNFGLHGYGPHQMLSALEHDLVTDIVNCKNNTHFIYQSLPEHVNRAVGLTSWDYHGPKYMLNLNGEAVFSGHFDDGDHETSAIIRKHLEKSLGYRNIFGINRAINDHDIDLFAAIVQKSIDTTAALFPNSTFDIIYWDRLNVTKVFEKVKSPRNAFHSINDILPNFKEKKKTTYAVSPHDEHPSALAHSIIAKYVADKIVK